MTPHRIENPWPTIDQPHGNWIQPTRTDIDGYEILEDDPEELIIEDDQIIPIGDPPINIFYIYAPRLFTEN